MVSSTLLRRTLIALAAAVVLGTGANLVLATSAEAQQNGTVVEKRCGECHKVVPLTSQVGMKCPHCGVIWGVNRSEWRDWSTGSIGSRASRAPRDTSSVDSRTIYPDLMPDLLAKTGLKFNKIDASSWVVPVEAQDQRTFRICVTYNNDGRKYAVLFATVVDRDDHFTFGKDVLLEAMELNNESAGVKFCADVDHGDIDVQSEVLMSTLTPAMLSEYIMLVAQAADENAERLNKLVP